ncbi:hypothetical protein MMC15_006706 [Xylographa vitiligo]|nr:hypothetical protein [Xylographa vitiligo]
MLMHAPIGTPLYGFLHIESLASISVLRRVHSAARGTESMFRLVLVITEDIPFALDKLRLDDCIDLDLTSEGSDFKEALDPVIKRSGDRPLEPNTGFTSFKPNDSEESTKIDAMLFQVLLLRLESLGRWAFVALPWIAYAIRPLSMQELDLIPAFEDAQLAAERILLIYFTALQLISRKFYQKLLRSAKGELSFAYLIQRYSIFSSQEAINDTPHKENKGDVHVRPTLSTLPSTKTSAWDFSKMTGLYSTITEYAVRNWIAHYRLAEMGYTLYDRFLLAFIGEETNIQKWLSLVESFSRPPQQKTNRVINLFNEQLREHLDMSFFKNLGDPLQPRNPSIILFWTRPLRADLMKSADRMLAKDLETLSIIQLTAQALGNHGISEKLTKELLSSLVGTLQAEWFSNASKIAVEYDEEEKIHRLLSYHDLVKYIDDGDEHRSDLGRTSLHIASQYGFLKTVNTLLSGGADVTASDMDGNLSLHLAIRNGNTSNVMEPVIQGTQPINTPDHDNNLVHDYDFQIFKDIYVFEDFLEGKLNYRDTRVVVEDSSSTALNKAKSGGRTLLISSKSALMVAASLGQSRMIQLLLTRGANLEVADLVSGYRAIHKAAQNGSLETAKILIDVGAQLEIENDMGQSPLTYAIYSERPVIVRPLLERGAIMNIPSGWKRYESMLDFSLGLSSNPVTMVLLDFYVQRKQDDGLLVIDAWMKKVAAKDSPIGLALHFAAADDNIEFLRQLLEHPKGIAAINDEIPKIGTILHTAICSGNNALERVQLLLE